MAETVEQSTNSCTNDESNVKNSKDQAKEYGGRKDGLDPTRYGDWEKMAAVSISKLSRILTGQYN